MKKVIFDLDGTLLKANWQYEEIYFKSILSPEDAEKFIPNISRLLAEYEKTYLRYDFDLLSMYLTEKSGVNISREIVKVWIEAGKDCDEIIAGADEILRYLKQKDKCIVGLSNWFTDMNVGRLKKAGLYDYFDEVYCSDVVDMKPNLGAYIAACGDTEFKDVVMIGDSLKNDVITPLELGINAIYFCKDNQEKVLNPKVKVIRKLNEIKEIY